MKVPLRDLGTRVYVGVLSMWECGLGTRVGYECGLGAHVVGGPRNVGVWVGHAFRL